MAVCWWLQAALCALCLASVSAEAPATCSLNDGKELDPNLREMTYDLGYGPQKAMVYVDPLITSLYRNSEPPAQTRVKPMFKGFQGKFINLSNMHLTLYWEDRPGGTKHVMRNHKAFSASGTATFPGHRFFFSPFDEPDTELELLIVGDYPQNIYYYDPYTVEGDPVQTQENLKGLTPADREKYQHWRDTLTFHEIYRNFTGRSYLANYLRKPPMHHMWRADYFNQSHWVTTRETHFESLPPLGELAPIAIHGTKRVQSQPQLTKYRVAQPRMNMSLRVLSCAPRVFEIPNFLSPVEVAHVLDLAAGVNLSLSATGDGGEDEKVKDDTRRTRTSYNSWVPREKSPITDAIYRRAADVMRIDEALLRSRPDGEYPELTSNNPLSESLQLVHYDVGQEYTAHHDFGFAKIDDPLQGARFATLLLYLNDGMEGGDTSFPRWQNAETFKELRVPPRAGNAVLFYSQLPDGNMDDFSHHAANPVTVGEKWLINLWVHDPIYD